MVARTLPSPITTIDKPRKPRRILKMMTLPFCAWDGEGITENGRHDYVLLANSLGGSLIRRGGIPTLDSLEMLANASPNHIHVGYALGYDINKMLKDIEREYLEALYAGGEIKWNGYRIEWRQGKCLTVSTRSRRTTLFDVFPFFQRSFVMACDEWLGEDWLDRDVIVREKQRRNVFTYDDLERVADYNDSELVNLVRLCDELRDRLSSVDIHVNRWDGPGAIATYLFKKHQTKQAIATVPDAVASAGRHAYAGGRFELIRKGNTSGKVYQYDIRSAYPSAMRELPCLACGTWKHVNRPTGIVHFGLYRIHVDKALTPTPTRPQPLWHRNKDGTVYFSEYPRNWYWSPEAELVADHVPILEGWEYHTNCGHKPFGFVEPIYVERAQLKRQGHGGHVAYKLGLNSLYGKLAQQLGWEVGPPLRTPPYHCLEWAGYITSQCRAQVYRAAQQAPDDIIAFETDAVFSRVPLSLTLGENLGEWEATVYTDFTYFKSGMYYGTKDDGTIVEKTRGINKGSVSREDVIAALAKQGKVEAEQTRFITLGQALHQDFSLWGQWVTAPRHLQSVLNGKRIDLASATDIWKDKGDGFSETQGGFHDTEGFSYPYKIEWLEGKQENPLGIDDLRRWDNENEWAADYD